MPDPQTTHNPTTVAALARSVEPHEAWVVAANGPLHQAMQQYVATPPDSIDSVTINKALGYLPFGIAIAVLHDLNDQRPGDISAVIAAATERDDPISRVLVQRIVLLDRAELIEQVFGVQHLKQVITALKGME